MSWLRSLNAMGIDTRDVIDAASSKWNFIKLNPGLVGGHCISVDPYYLIQKAQVYGVLPRIMSAARRLNDGMGDYVANQTIKLMNKSGILVKDSNILILGITFKENCPDVRNTKVLIIYSTLSEYTSNITVLDPWANVDRVKKEYGIDAVASLPKDKKYDAIILAVSHKQFADTDWREKLNENGVIYDVKGFLNRTLLMEDYKYKLSIIIPMYNAEKYIGICLDSILNSNLSKADYEIVIVNDGSKDKSPEIAKTYASQVF